MSAGDISSLATLRWCNKIVWFCPWWMKLKVIFFSFYCEGCSINFLQDCGPSSRWKSFFRENTALTVWFMSLCNLKPSWHIKQQCWELYSSAGKLHHLLLKKGLSKWKTSSGHAEEETNIKITQKNFDLFWIKLM